MKKPTTCTLCHNFKTIAGMQVCISRIRSNNPKIIAVIPEKPACRYTALYNSMNLSMAELMVGK
jgi:hypothetical protein